MTSAFHRLLSPDQIARLETEHRELVRLSGLPDRWLAAYLLKAARHIRSLDTSLQTPWVPSTGYESLLLWEVIPSLCHRLGAPIRAPECRDLRVRALSPAELRKLTASTLRNVDQHFGPGRSCEEWRILTRHPTNGNPIVFALDRVAPAVEADWISAAAPFETRTLPSDEPEPTPMRL